MIVEIYMNTPVERNWVVPFGFAVISMAVVGYFVGLQSPVRTEESASETEPPELQSQVDVALEEDVLPATRYDQLAAAWQAPSPGGGLSDLKSTIDPLQVIEISEEQKQATLARREQARAFNGAPPTVPHAMDQFSTAACIACHTQGAVTTSLRVPQMSHAAFSSCTQCHVQQHSEFTVSEDFRQNSFEGLAAPEGGPRAFALAPPMIPHTTWMRENCQSCHGPTGSYGIRSTHPWRQSCQQCHAPSHSLDQILVNETPQLLPLQPTQTKRD